MSWSTLSEDVWKQILLHVPFAQRLESCSRVNKALCRAAAAAAATQHIELDEREARVQRLQDLCRWMLHHGQHLTSLQLCGPGTLTQLPCPNLRELALGSMRVQLSASSTQPGVLHSCTRLTELFFIFCQFADGHSSLAALSSLVQLQRLTILDAVSEFTDDGGMPSTVLQHLKQLTHLSLYDTGGLLSMESLQHASGLVNLQELCITDSTVPLSPSTTPGWSRLTALQSLDLRRTNLDPSILQDCTQLEGLKLHSLAIISAGDAAALHSLLGRLQQLHLLQLVHLEYDWPVAAAAYSSLTASSHLQTLKFDIDDLTARHLATCFPTRPPAASAA